MEENKNRNLTGTMKIYQAFQLEFDRMEKLSSALERLAQDELVISEMRDQGDQRCIDLKPSFYEFLDARQDYIAQELQNDIRKYYDPGEVNTKTEKMNIAYEAEAAITMDMGEKGIHLTVDSRMRQKYLDFLEMAAFKNNEDRRIYGSRPVNSRKYFLLYPVMVTFKNGHRDFLDVQLDVFHNGMGILTISIDLDGTDASPLLEYHLAELFQEVCLISCLSGGDKLDYYAVGDAEIEDIFAAYDKHIAEILDCKISSSQMFNHIMITEPGKPIQNFSQIDKDSMEFLYRIIAAPVDLRADVREKACEYIKTQYWGSQEFRCYMSPTGGCMSVSTQQRKNKFLENQASKDEYRQWELLSIDSTLDIPIKICLMKKLAYQTLIYKINSFQIPLEQCRREFLLKENYIITLQEACYGSVSELLEFMEAHMPYFLKKDLAEKQIKNMELLIDGKREEAKEQMNLFVSVAAFVITTLFALPVICDTVEILRDFLGITCVPGVSVVGVSIAVWGMMILLSGGYGIWRYRNRKYRIKSKQ